MVGSLDSEMISGIEKSNRFPIRNVIFIASQLLFARYVEVGMFFFSPLFDKTFLPTDLIG